MKIEYKIGENIIDIISNALLEIDKLQDYLPHYVSIHMDRRLYVETGIGGMTEINKYINNNHKTNLYFAKDEKINKFKTFKIKNLRLVGLGDLIFSHNNFLDSWQPDGSKHDFVYGELLSSYNIHITFSQTDDIIDIIPIGYKIPENINKYYWISYNEIEKEKLRIINKCININPLTSTYKYILLNWKEITKEEYDLFNEINIKNDKPI